MWHLWGHVKVSKIFTSRIKRLNSSKYGRELTYGRKLSTQTLESSPPFCLNHSPVNVALYGCYSRANYSKINKLHERCLGIIYTDKTSSFETRLKNDGSEIVSFSLAKCKANNSLFAPILTELFKREYEHQCNLRHNLVYHVTESVSSWVLKFGNF